MPHIPKFLVAIAATLLSAAVFSTTRSPTGFASFLGSGAGCGGCHEVFAFEGVETSPEGECIVVSVAPESWRPNCGTPETTVTNECAESFVATAGSWGSEFLETLEPGETVTFRTDVLRNTVIEGNIGVTPVTLRWVLSVTD